MERNVFGDWCRLSGRSGAAGRAVVLTGTATLLVLVCAGCDLLSVLSPPLGHSGLEAILEDHGSLHRIAGVHFVAHNRGSLDIASFDVAFSLYDSEGLPFPSIATNTVAATLAGRVPAGADRRFSVSLDPLVEVLSSHEIPDSLHVARFRVIRVSFSDGTTWGFAR